MSTPQEHINILLKTLALEAEQHGRAQLPLICAALEAERGKRGLLVAELLELAFMEGAKWGSLLATSLVNRSFGTDENGRTKDAGSPS